MLILLTHPDDSDVLINTAHIVSADIVHHENETFTKIVMTHGDPIIVREEPDEIVDIIAQA
jgi:uncharacterized protein YlzI (FlbEa/FlbD family)